jgi:hypothetical protein
MTALADHIDRVVERARAFYSSQEPGHLLVNAYIPVECPAIPPLHSFDLDQQLNQWLAYQLEAARPGWRAKEGLDDDSIPAICPFFGIAEHSAWLGMDVILQETTCLPIPIIKTPHDLSRLRLSEENKWFGYMKRGYEYLRSRLDGSFVLSVRGALAPMDMANALRGDELFVDFLLQPDWSHKLMDWLVEAIHWYFGHLLSWAQDIDGGHVFNFGGGWMPPRTIGHLANDAAMLCSPAIYDQFGYPYESRLVSRYDWVLYHVHNEKTHHVPRLATLPHLALLEVTGDPKTIPPIDDLKRIFAATQSVNLMLHADSDQVREHIAELENRNAFLLVTCRDRADAEDIVAFVRDRSKPL